MSAREEILGRVRAALADVAEHDPGAADASTSAPASGAADHGAFDSARPVDEQLAARFAQRASEYRATVRHATSATLAAAIAQACADHGARRLATSPALPADWTAAAAGAFELIPDDGLSARRLDELDGAITGAALAIAATGTLVLDGGPLCGRRTLTLIPDLHVCVVDAAAIVADLAAAFAVLGPARPLTFVSGPSATSDIELDRVEGVHGPRRLEIVVVED